MLSFSSSDISVYIVNAYPRTHSVSTEQNISISEQILKDEVRLEKNTVINFTLDVNVGKNTSVRVTSDIQLGGINIKDPENKLCTKCGRKEFSTTNLFFRLPSPTKVGSALKSKCSELCQHERFLVF